MKHVISTIVLVFSSIVFSMANTQENADINIAPFSKIYTTPYIGFSTYKYVDGEIDTPQQGNILRTTPLPIKHSSKINLELEFRFNSPQLINRIRIYQANAINRNYASSYTISYKKSLNDTKQLTVTTESNAKPYKWFEYTFSPAILSNSIYIKPNTLSTNKGPSYGGPLFSEIEIYAETYSQNRTQSLTGNNNEIKHTLTVDKSKSIRLPADLSIKKPWNEQFQKGLFSSIWYFEKDESNNTIKDPRYLSILKDLGITRVWLYLNLYRNSNEAIFPQNMLPHPDSQPPLENKNQKIPVLPFKNDYMPYINSTVVDNLINRLHSNNIGVIANEPFLPVKNKSWGFPRVFEPENFPCLLTSSALHDIAVNYYDTLLSKPFDGISVGGDEFFFYGHKAHDMTNSLFCKQSKLKDCNSSFNDSFKRRFPLKSQLSHINIKTHEYELLADLFARLSRKIKAKGAISSSLFFTGNHNRPGFGVAHDIIGHQSDLDEMTVDPYWSHNNYLDTSYFSIETKKILAATPTRNAHITLQATPDFTSEEFQDDIMIYGPAVASIMNGISGINYYKIDYLLKKGLKSKSYTRVKKIFNLARFLEENDFLSYTSPRHIALLYSRSAEDEWQLNNKHNQPYHAALFQNAIIQSLIKQSIPFDIFYLDQASTIPDLSQYDLTLIPLNHSINKLALPKLGTAKNILAFQSKHINQNEKSSDVSNTIKSLDNAYQYSIDLDRTNFNELSELIHNKITVITGSPPTLSTSSLSDIECNIVKKNHDFIMYCINWGNKDSELNISMNIPDSNYNIWTFNADRLSPVTINQDSLITQSQLRNARIEIPAKAFSVYLFDEIDITGKNKWFNIFLTKSPSS